MKFRTMTMKYAENISTEFENHDYF